MIDLKRLHAIRGFASLFVVIYHAKFVLWCGGTEFLRVFPRSGWTSFDYLVFALDLLSSAGLQMVVAFFILSGFFITRSLEERGTTKGFYRNRLVRIYIPYIASLFLGASSLFLVHRLAPELFTDAIGRELNARLLVAFDSLHWKNFIQSLFFLKDREYLGFNYPYWSLHCEAIFYLTIPFLFRRASLFFGVSVLLAVANFLFADLAGSGELAKYFFRFQVFFALGTFLYQKREAFLRPVLSPLLLFWAALTGFAVMLVLAILHHENAANLFSAAVTVLLLSHLPSLQVTGRVSSALWRFFEGLGTISFSLYITHLPVMLLVYLVLHKATGDLIIYRHYYPLGVFAALIFSLIFFQLVERPSLVLLKRVVPRKSQKKAV